MEKMDRENVENTFGGLDDIEISLASMVMPQNSTLLDELAELGVEADLLVTVDDVPYVLAQYEERRIQFHFLPVDGEHFVLNMVHYVSDRTMVEDTSEGSLKGFDSFLICERFNAGSLLASAVYNPMSNEYMLRMAIPTMGMPFETEYIQYLLSLFSESVMEFETMLQDEVNQE